MKNLEQKFQDIKTLLSRRASASLGPAVLAAFIKALDDYGDELTSALASSATERADLKGENELLRGLIGIADPAVQAKIIEQGEEIRFLRRQLIEINQTLERVRGGNDSLKVAAEEKNNELLKERKAREEEQARFNGGLEEVRRQAKEIEQKALEKYRAWEQEKNIVRRECDERIRDGERRSEDELRSIAVRLHALCWAAQESVERSRCGVPGSAEATEDLGRAADSLRAATGAMGDYLAILDAPVVRPAKVNWAGFWNDMKIRAAALPEAGGVAITWPDPRAAGAFTSDGALLGSAVEALVRNALESMPGGGALDVGMRFMGRTAAISVSDSGSGVTPGDIGRIFLPFYTTKNGHAGLGLTRALRLAAALGGTLTFEPKANGSRFVLAVPDRETATPPPPPKRGK